MSSNITLWCTLKPVKGKEDRLRHVLLDLSEKVREVEMECLKYQVFEEAKTMSDGVTDITFYLLERWMSQEDLDRHTQRDWLMSVRNTFEEEGLLVGEEVIQPVATIGGFGARY